MATAAPEQFDNLRAMARQVAQGWESFAKLKERTSQRTALLNAAAAYDFAGYQANAACLARHVASQSQNGDAITALSATFLQRFFLKTKALAGQLVREPSETNSDALMKAAGEGLFAEALNSGAAYFLTGREAFLQDAAQLLEKARQGFILANDLLGANLSTMMRSLLVGMKLRSTWSVLLPILPGSHYWRRYLTLLARGPGQDVLRTPGVAELWPSQLEAVDKKLFDSSTKIVRMPTSAGKTRVAELAIAHALASNPASKCIYLAPYRALVSELEQLFLPLFADLGFRVSSIEGSFELDDFEKFLASNADLLVVTPEKLDLILRLNPELLGSVSLVVVDEGHIISDGARGIKVELLLTRLRRSARRARLLFLSAVVPDITLREFSEWLHIGEGDVIQSAWRAAIQRYAYFEWRGNSGSIQYSPDEDVENLRRAFVPGLIYERQFEFVNPRTRRRNTRRFPEKTHKGQVAAELALRYSEIGPVLIFCAQPNFAEGVAKALMNRLSLAELVGETIPAHFNGSETRSYLVAAEWLGEENEVTRTIRRGVAVHHGDLPDPVRKAIEADFRSGKLRVLAATNTLGQGVNLPVRTVIIHSCWRGDSEGNRHRISGRDYWNIAGRAGRARHETEGTIIHLALTESDHVDFEYYRQRRTDLEPVNSALFDLLQSLVAQRISSEELRDYLDPELLAVIVEEGLDTDSISRLEEIASQTLAYTQASLRSVDPTPLRNAFRESGRYILGIAEDDQMRKVFAGTGLTTRSCVALADHARANAAELTMYILELADQDLMGFVELLFGACSSIPEMQSDRTFAGSVIELLKRWVAGAHITELRQEFGAIDAESDLTKFIEDMFGYRLPWGVASYLKVARFLCEINDDVIETNTSRFIPSMLRFGVPSPEAAWAMSMGIPVRQVAIDLGNAFVRENEARNYSSFVEWISLLDSDTLLERFGITGVVLEELTRAISRSGRNQLLKDFAGVETVMPLRAELTGTKSGARRNAALRLRTGQELQLLRDYDNGLDRNAVEARHAGAPVGYLPRHAAQLLAPEIDSGRSLKAVVATTSQGQISVVVSMGAEN